MRVWVWCQQTLRPFSGAGMRVWVRRDYYGGCDLTLTVETTCSRTGRQRLFEMRHPIDERGAVGPHVLYAAVHGLICEFTLHEVDEWFRVDGQFYRAPHPEDGERGWVS